MTDTIQTQIQQSAAKNEQLLDRAALTLTRNYRIHDFDKADILRAIARNDGKHAMDLVLVAASRARSHEQYEADQGEAAQNSLREDFEG